MRTATQLHGLAIVRATDGQLIGRIQDVFFDARSGQITGFLIEQTGVSGERFLAAGLVQTVGTDAAMLKGEAVPEETGMAPTPSQGVSAHSLAGRPVLNESGNVVGKITEVLVDGETMTISALLLSTGLLDRVLHGDPQVPFAHVAAVGNDAIVLNKESAAQSEKIVPPHEA